MYNKDRLAQIEQTLPPADETRARLRRYLELSGVTSAQFAELTGYAPPAIRQFAAGTYSQRAGTDVPVRKAIEETINKYPVGDPKVSETGCLYETENLTELRHWFWHCHEHRALAFTYGPPGSQKTFGLKHLVAEFNRINLPRTDVTFRAWYVRSSVTIRPRDLVVKMCQESGAPTGSSLQRCMTSLRITLRETQALYVVDEGQHLSIDCLEALRELHDEDPRVGILLAGSHKLKDLFHRRSSELEQWNSRLDAGIELTGISEQRAREIVRAELPNASAKQVDTLVHGATVEDKYSTDTNRRYLNVRRLFKNMESLRQLRATKQKETAA